MRILKFVFERSETVQVRPHVLAVPPSMFVVRVVPKTGVVFAAVHVTPPFHDSCTHIRGEPVVLSTRASVRTSMPSTVAFDGMLLLNV